LFFLGVKSVLFLKEGPNPGSREGTCLAGMRLIAEDKTTYTQAIGREATNLPFFDVKDFLSGKKVFNRSATPA